MRVLLLVEKPYMAKTLAPVAARRWPGASLQVVCVSPLGVFRPRLPRGLSWSDYPFLSPFEPERFVLDPQALFQGWEWSTSQGELQKVWVRDEPQARQWFEQADVVVATYSNAHLFQMEVVCQKLLGKSLETLALPVRVWSLALPFLEEAFATADASNWEPARAALEVGRARHYFHHHFSVNSMAVLRKTAEGLSSSPSPWVSKYQLQLIQAMANSPEKSEGEWIREMDQWKGTGRYPALPNEPLPGLGSIMSRAQVLSQLLDHGWCRMLEDGSRRISITPEGEEFVRRLHPDCWDPDLPFRLEQWAGEGLAKSQGAMDRYIRTFFGKQKRFLDQGRRR